MQTQKDLPIQLLTSRQPLRATLLLASFGPAQGFSNHVFNLEVTLDPSAPLLKYEKPLRYGKLEEIHHIFKADPKSGPKIISLFFVLAVLATVPVLLGAVRLDNEIIVFAIANWVTVGISWSQHLPPLKSSRCSTYCSHSILRLNIIHGGDFLPLLLQLDFVPNVTSLWCRGFGSFLEWEQGFVRGTKSTSGW
jgi:hypothetical protein